MKPYHADCLEVLRELPDNSVDALITDPPYGLSNHKPEEVRTCLAAWLNGEVYTPKGKGFMSQPWDAWVPGPEIWKECLRVVKPGGHALVFTGTRSMDLMGMALRLAEWEPKDTISWVYSTGFPKSLDVSKTIDKKMGQERTEGKREWKGGLRHSNSFGGGSGQENGTTTLTKYDTPASPEAEQWDGWGTALKPAHEDILLLKKPHKSSIVENVLEWGTGGLNIDQSRVPIHPEQDASQLRTMTRNKREEPQGWGLSTVSGDTPQVVHPAGRWPANLILDGSEEVTALFPESGSKNPKQVIKQRPRNKGWVNSSPGEGVEAIDQFGDSGSAARFFKECPQDKPRLVYCPKASRSERNQGLNGNNNSHSTVKPLTLMRYLCTLITPPGGTILDPFMGSGTTGKAALQEGFDFIGIEISEEYFKIAEARIKVPTTLKFKLRFK
jgi:site-specific DNA-methyltransferase (adenine-specific)